VMKMIRIPSWWLLGLGIFLAGCSPADRDSGPVFEDAWIRDIPPGMKMTAGFGKLSNPEPLAIGITSYSSPDFADVSLHRTEMVDGMSKMREVPLLTIPAGETIELAPGGYHLMLMMPTAVIEPGTRIVVDLKSTGGQIFSFNIPVERR